MGGRIALALSFSSHMMALLFSCFSLFSLFQVELVLFTCLRASLGSLGLALYNLFSLGFLTCQPWRNRVGGKQSPSTRILRTISLS